MDFTKLREFQDWMSEFWRIPGSTCVAYVNGEKVYEHSAGYADVEKGEKMKGDELMFMYSITKIVTTLSALQLLEKGLFHLNDTLDYYMPEFSDMKVRKSDENGEEIIVPAEKKILVRDLFQMTCGYDYNLETEQIKARMSEPGKISTMEMAKALAETPLLFEPGDKWCYGLGHDILAAFVEKLTGKRFADYVKENIFEPVGMKNSYFHLPEEEIEKRMAQQYCFDDTTVSYKPIGKWNWAVFGNEYDSGGAGIISTVSDIALLAKVIAGGGVTDSGIRIISKATIDLWRTNCLDEKQMFHYCWDALKGYGYGLGVRTHIDRAKSGSLSSIGEFGWTGAAGGFLIIDPDKNVALYYAHHMQNNQEYFTNPRLRNLLYSCLEY